MYNNASATSPHLIHLCMIADFQYKMYKAMDNRAACYSAQMVIVLNMT